MPAVAPQALRINQPFDGWTIDPKELFGADDSQADLDGDQAFSRAELVSAVLHVLNKRNLKGCGTTPKTRATPRALARPTAAHPRANRWYNFVVDKL